MPVPRVPRPTVEARLGKWEVAFRAILEVMVKESKQPNDSLTRMDLTSTAAAIAATLVIGAELG